MKRFLAIVLCAIMLVGLLPAAFAQELEDTDMPEFSEADFFEETPEEPSEPETETDPCDFVEPKEDSDNPEIDGVETEELYLYFVGYDTLDEDGTAVYELTATEAGAELELTVFAESNGTLSYCWQKPDIESGKYMDIEDASNEATLSVIVAEEDFDAELLYRCVVTASLEGTENLTATAAFTIRPELAEEGFGAMALESSDIAPADYLTFSSASPFTLVTANASKNWDGTLYYSTDAENWSEWDGTEINSSEDGKLFLCGNGNTFITRSEAGRFILNGNILACTGNIETLLDYEAVARNEHPLMSSRCYCYLFSNCTSLTTAPELPTTTLAESCYSSMFYNCTALTVAPELPATTLDSFCYDSMFKGCISLTTAPTLPATTLADQCYAYMFSGCTSMATSVALPATMMVDNCYYGMFSGCTSLTAAPTLPATTMAHCCYSDMFSGCVALTTAPELPATTLASSCYAYMFSGCTALTAVPALPANTLENACYHGMFSDCISLKLSKTKTSDCYYKWRVPVVGTDITTAPRWSSDMFTGTGGSFTADPQINTTYYVNWDTGEVASDYITFSSAEPFTLATANASKNWDGTLYYSPDAMNWLEWDGTTISSSDTGNLYLCGLKNKVITGHSDSTPSLHRFVLSGNNVSCSGNIETLLDYENVSQGFHPRMDFYCFAGMFSTCSSLITAPILPANGLTFGCYQGMFYQCISLTEAPSLLATMLAEYCYDSMFFDCTSPISVSELPATELAKYCYRNMFSGCTSLANAPMLPAISLVNNCYESMFSGCTALTAPPSLPASTLANYCYKSMFSNCTLITDAPALPVTALPSGCYEHMFSGCSSLTSAPALPATALANYCYAYIFSDCTSLTAAPSLPATTLAEGCYFDMFNGCKSLKLSKTITHDCRYEWRIPNAGSIEFEPRLWNTIMLSGTGGSFTGDPDINTTYYVNWDTGKLSPHEHSWDAGEVTTEPNCTAAGVNTFHCTGCGETKTEPVAPNGHTEVIDSAVEATCTESGKTDGKHCSVCNAVIVVQHPVPAKGHTEVIDAAVEATCTEPGKTEGKHCSVCNAVIKAQQTVPANGHTEVTDTAVEPTCTEPGKTEGKHCSVCGAVIVAQHTIPAKGHSWDEGSITTEPTCTAEGVKSFHCKACDATKTEEVDALGHSFEDGKCTRCDAPEGYLIKLTLPSADLDGINVWVDGVEYPATVIGGELCTRIPHTDAKTAVVNVFNSSTGDIHTQYPVGMYVWTLSFEGDEYTAEYMPDLDDLLKYAGMSIRVPAYGIRMISSVPDELRSSGLAGYTLEEYGTQVKGPNNTISATAYKRGAQDSVYKQSGGRTFYTNVLVDFPTKEDCLKELNMRPYVVLSKDGETITLYGGWVQRSIWYVATQNKDAFPDGSEYDNFIEQIISYKEG